jgi:dUTP pyrophosphatase
MSSYKANKYTLYIKCNSSSPDQYNYYIDLSSKCLTTEDSGVDLYIPSSIALSKGIETIDHMISCYMVETDTSQLTGYYLYPRSSIYKYPIMLANCVGIIDAGYRGNIKAIIRCFEDNYEIEKGFRLFQICAPDLSPLKIKVIDSNDPNLIPESVRGNNGFGSSGN